MKKAAFYTLLVVNLMMAIANYVTFPTPMRPGPAFAGLTATNMSPNPGGTSQPWWFSQSTAAKRGCSQFGITGGAGATAVVLLFNPTASGITIIVDQLNVLAGTNVQNVLVKFQTSTAGFTQNTTNIGNCRQGGASMAATYWTSTSGPAPGNAIFGFGVGTASATVMTQLGFTLPATSGISFENTVNATSLNGGLQWFEQ